MEISLKTFFSPFLKTIVIVGSGVFGVTAAIELHNRGHTVTLCDQGPIPYVNASSTDINKARFRCGRGWG